MRLLGESEAEKNISYLPGKSSVGWAGGSPGLLAPCLRGLFSGREEAEPLWGTQGWMARPGHRLWRQTHELGSSDRGRASLSTRDSQSKSITEFFWANTFPVPTRSLTTSTHRPQWGKSSKGLEAKSTPMGVLQIQNPRSHCLTPRQQGTRGSLLPQMQRLFGFCHMCRTYSPLPSPAVQSAIVVTAHKHLCTYVQTCAHRDH